jgi:ATP-binding cassette subfamily B protein
MIPVTRAHAVENVEMEKVNRNLNQVRKSGEKVDWSNGWFGSLAWAVFTLLTLGGYVLSGWLCYTKLMPLKPGDIALLGGYFGQITASATALIGMFPAVAKGFEAVRSIGDIMENPDIELDRNKPAIGDVCGAITFDHVDFIYPGSESAAIKNLHLDIASGSTVAFVGPSGSGKSTIMGLILGFNRPSHGRILLDGHNMSEIDMRSFRESVAVVSQDTILFQGTLRENILYGAQNVTEARLEKALKDANAFEFIHKLPEGLETMLGERGARLSGGQKQRIAIARAIIREPRVLILDEATSALDVEAEFVVQEALDRLMKGRTTFIVAHRLSTIRNAGLIVLLDGGRISEMGTHRELIDRGDMFANMYNLQVTGGRPYA